MRYFPLLLAFLYGTTLVVAEDTEELQICAKSINSAVALLSFSTPDSTQDDACTNRLRTYSLYAAIKLYCTAPEINPGLEEINKGCRGERSRPPYKEIEPDLTDSYLESLRVVDYQEVLADEKLQTAVLISRTYFDKYYRTLKEWAVQARTRRQYGHSTYWFWGIVLLLGSLNRIFDHFSHSRRRRYSRDPETHYQYPRPKNEAYLAPFKYAHHWVRTHIIIPAAFGSHRQQLVWWCTIPTRMEAIVIVSYYVLSLILGISNYDNLFTGNAYYYNTSSQFWRYFSDRTGVMSYPNLALLWLFGGRNNVFLWATGWNFSTFNLFHRAIARVATIEAIAHSVGYTILTMMEGSYSSYWPDPWWYMGVVATISMSLLLGFSSIWLRRNYYEVFLIIHIALSVITLLGLFVHTSIFLGEYEPYLWPAVGIWCFDRFARLVRLVCCNTYLRLNRHEISTTRSAMSYSKGSDIIRLEIIPGSPMVRPEPGQHYYLYQPTKWRGYENHPFTLGSWCPVDRTDREPFKEHKATGTSISVLSCPSENFRDSREQEHQELNPSYKLIFWIRPFDGWTHRLRDECSKNPDKTITNANFLLEGPYGMRAPVYNYENVIFIAGGTGIAAALPYIEDIARRATSASDFNKHPEHQSSSSSSSSAGLLPSQNADRPSFPTTSPSDINIAPPRTRKITLIWAARQAAFIHNLASQELGPVLQQCGDCLSIDAQFYSTEHVHTTHRSQHPLQQQQQCPSLDEGGKVLTENTRLLSPKSLPDTDFEAVDIEDGRPDIKRSIMRAIDDDASRTAVLVCGPAGMADEARVAVHHALKEGTRGVEYFEETFGW